MKLSIITINYNNAEGLKRTVLSVINQSYTDLQYIVIDGNSTDYSKNILDQFRDKIDIAISEPDKGIYNAMNKGASYAKGEYLMFLNSGDELLSQNTLEEVFKNDIDKDIVCGRVYNCSEKDAYEKIPPENVSLFTFINASLPHPSALIKNDLFKKMGGYIEDYKIISDWCFFIDATIVHRCSYKTIQTPMVLFRRDGISSTQGRIEAPAQMEFLQRRFGPIMNDYLSLHDECISNFSFWLASQKPSVKLIFTLPIKIINSILNMRMRLSRRIVAKKMKTNPLTNR